MTVAVAPPAAVEWTRRPRYAVCEAYDQAPLQWIAVDESATALAWNVAELTHEPTVPFLSTARTRKRTGTPAGTIRLEALVVAEARASDAHDPSPMRRCSS